jgi:transcriptional regulator with XRE-family HTH domain
MVNSVYHEGAIYFCEMSAAMTTDETRKLQGDRIRKARRKAGLSQDALAQAVNVRRQAVYEWEHGKASPSMELLKYIAKAMNTNTSYLSGEIDYDKPLTQKQEDLLRAADRNDIQAINKIFLDKGRQVLEDKGEIARSNPKSK